MERKVGIPKPGENCMVVRLNTFTMIATLVSIDRNYNLLMPMRNREVMIPGYIIYRLVQLRNKLELYPGDPYYQPHWSTRFGFLFAGYEPEYAWWEMVVLLRKAIFFSFFIAD